MLEVSESMWIGAQSVGIAASCLIATDMIGGIGPITFFVIACWVIFLITLLVYSIMAFQTIGYNHSNYFQYVRLNLGWGHLALVVLTLISVGFANALQMEGRSHLTKGALMSFLVLQVPLFILYFFNYTTYTRPEVACSTPGAQKQLDHCYAPCKKGFCGVGAQCWRQFGPTCPVVIGQSEYQQNCKN